ncbi:cadmium-translocating P-type ATPase [Halorussus gelatinilyticus]|uniref:Cadmium-translocating P-type ATPase n=1 Tax=Halorussus gelatinilyticus TaxID=2937524 RepID=A0A8U0IQ42_9EURY|nr:heavy metal translocating P-type ATPase [Halorussus gelatinilyticus]UPW02129.1 cadmium-translocating P-type ATPase [Halorussus gelatinilyticus]
MTTDERERTVRLSVPEMDCPSCAGKVTASVERLDGVRETDPAPTTGTLRVAYDGEETDAAAVRERVEAAGYAVEGDAAGADGERRFSVPEMDCPSCAGKVENALDGVAGVESFETHPATGEVLVTGDADREAVVAAIEGAGYDVANAEADGESGPDVAGPSGVWTSSRALKTWTGGALMVVGLLLEFLVTSADVLLFAAVGREFHLSSVFLLLAAAVAGQEILRNGYYSAKTLSLDIDLLMGTGVLAAVAVGLYFEAATLAVLYSVAELLERFSMDRARSSVRELMDLSPDTATVKRGADGADGEREETVPVEEVAVGEVVVVRPGEKIPVDGEVVEGASAVNQAPITGESVPVDKSPGAEVYAGTVNQEGYLEVKATAEADETTLSQVVELVGDAQRDRTDREQFIERFAAYYTPIIVVAALLTAFGPPLVLGGAFREWFVRGLTLLVVACPCAFVISTPVSVVSGVTSAARNGVLVKGGPHLESMGSVEAVAFDKTGTLTAGELAVTDVVALNGTDEADLLRCAHDLERRSEHPLAEAIVEYAHGAGDPHDESGEDRPIENFESLTGKGVRADLGGVTHYAGKPALFEELGFDLEHVHLSTDGGRRATDGGEMVAQAAAKSRCDDREDCLDLLADVVPRFQREGKTVVLVGTADELEGVLAVADEVRPAAAETVARLQSFGIETVMLTGDNEGTARAVAEEVGVDEFRAELLPEQKVEVVEELTDRYDSVAMVGDGVNDAPALAAATVGVAMGAAGTDTAIETADIALLGDDLRKVPYLYRLSRKANRVIRQNIWASLAVKAVLAVGAPLGLVSVAVAIVVGDMGMSLGVTGNAMRLARVDPDE